MHTVIGIGKTELLLLVSLSHTLSLILFLKPTSLTDELFHAPSKNVKE